MTLDEVEIEIKGYIEWENYRAWEKGVRAGILHKPKRCAESDEKGSVSRDNSEGVYSPSVEDKA
jgi:hypothetical protein